MKKRMVVVALFAVGSLSSCGAIIGTPSYVRETARWHNGGLSVAKMKNDLTTDEYHATQQVQEKEKTKRKLGYFEQLTNEWEAK